MLTYGYAKKLVTAVAGSCAGPLLHVCMHWLSQEKSDWQILVLIPLPQNSGVVHLFYLAVHELA